MLQILEMTEATLATLTPRSEKHGDDEVPAVSLGLAMTVSNELLDSIDKDLAPRMFKHPDSKPIPGVRDALTVLACNSIERVTLPTKYEGWTLQVDDGIDDTKPLTFGGCKVDKLSVEPMQGGSIVLRMRVGTSDLDAERSGMLGMHVGRSIWITLTSPKPGEEPAKDAKPAKGKDKDAGDLFAENEAAGMNKAAEPSRGPAWPFPTGDRPAEAPPKRVTEDASPGRKAAAARAENKKAATKNSAASWRRASTQWTALWN